MRTLIRLTALVALSTMTAYAATPFDGALPRALCAGWQGERTCELLHEDQEIRVLRCTFPPNTGHEPHFHPPHFGYVLEGDSVMRITTAEGVVDRPVHAGQSFSSDVEVRHQALNVGEQTTRYLIVEKKYADERPLASVAPGLCPASTPEH